MTHLSEQRPNEPMRRPLAKKWYTCAEVAEMLGFGEAKVRMLVIQGDLKSLKDGGSRRILPEWVDEYVAMRAQQAIDSWA
jgi:excisionase family DNA binding protein